MSITEADGEQMTSRELAVTSPSVAWMSDELLGGVIAAAVGGFTVFLLLCLVLIYVARCRYRKRREMKPCLTSRDTFTYAKQYDSGSDTSSSATAAAAGHVTIGTGSCRVAPSPSECCACAAGDSGISTLDLRRLNRHHQHQPTTHPLEPSIVVVVQSRSPEVATRVAPTSERSPNRSVRDFRATASPTPPASIHRPCRHRSGSASRSPDGSDMMAIATNPIFNLKGDVFSPVPPGLSDDYCSRVVDEAFGAIVNPAFSWNLQETAAISL